MSCPEKETSDEKEREVAESHLSTKQQQRQSSAGEVGEEIELQEGEPLWAELLDATLADFDKKKEEKLKKEEEAKETKAKSPEEGRLRGGEADAWTETFIQQMTKQFEENMRQLIGGESGAGGLGGPLDVGADPFGNPGVGGPDPSNLESLFKGLMSEDSAPSDSSMAPMIQGIVEQLLSKDLIYPSMKDIRNGFPDWMSKNSPNLSSEELLKREKQFEIITHICRVYEDEKVSESDRNSRVFQLMNELQKFGHPPDELIGGSQDPSAVGNFFGGGIGDAPSPGMDPNCSIV